MSDVGHPSWQLIFVCKYTQKNSNGPNLDVFKKLLGKILLAGPSQAAVLSRDRSPSDFEKNLMTIHITEDEEKDEEVAEGQPGGIKGTEPLGEAESE